ncbi:hypothetical protein DMC30DRAFT_348813 [Rhodotorula diobovata]|uniref:Uncharacterized protein n=1 Tax=Rhodotorula diobovata TaxID=5288 RepID=A0A5C5G3V9_9BASI|nr:hypothetical protein DMC30DRAFT_348813 [Rhodotorula diobovata]
MPSCLTLFDNFLLCYSLASQIKSVYRHGAPRECTPKFEDFKFCMSIKNLSDEQRDEVWVRRRAEWWARRRLGKSSEDVWEARRCVALLSCRDRRLFVWEVLTRRTARRDVYTDPLEEKRKAAAAEAAASQA